MDKDQAEAAILAKVEEVVKDLSTEDYVEVLGAVISDLQAREDAAKEDLERQD